MGHPAIPENVTDAELLGLRIVAEPNEDGVESDSVIVLLDGRRITEEDQG